MQIERLKDIDQYAAALGETLGRWTPPQRMAFAAALAERWLPVYELTSRSASPETRALLRQAVDAVWDAACGKRHRQPSELDRLRHGLAEAESAQASSGNGRGAGACRIINAALDSCGAASGVDAPRRAAVMAYDVAAQPVPGNPPDATRKRLVWEQFGVRAEMNQHETMITLVGESPVIDDGTVERLKRNCIPALPHMPEHLEQFASRARALEEINPAMGQISGIFERMSSFFGMLQGPKAKEELSALIQKALPNALGGGSRYEPEHARYVSATLHPWSDERRLAFVAALAERWLPEYEAYAAAERWGNPTLLRQAMDAVWGHLRGRRLSERMREDYSEQVRDNTPHTEDLDSNEPLIACMVLDYALECCGDGDSLPTAEAAALECCEARMRLDSPLPADPERERERWAEPAVRDEVAAQTVLLERIGAVSRFDGESVDALRAFAAQR
jgi:uncharacterized protein YjaG (DUF416 family)